MIIKRSLHSWELPELPPTRQTRWGRQSMGGLQASFLLWGYWVNTLSLSNWRSRPGDQNSHLGGYFHRRCTRGPACVCHMGWFLSQLKDKQPQKTHGTYATVLRRTVRCIFHKIYKAREDADLRYHHEEPAGIRSFSSTVFMLSLLTKKSYRPSGVFCDFSDTNQNTHTHNPLLSITPWRSTWDSVCSSVESTLVNNCF